MLSFTPQFFINQHSTSQMSYLLFMTPDINLQAQCQSISLSDPSCAPEQQPCRLSGCNSEEWKGVSQSNILLCESNICSLWCDGCQTVSVVQLGNPSPRPSPSAAVIFTVCFAAGEDEASLTCVRSCYLLLLEPDLLSGFPLSNFAGLISIGPLAHAGICCSYIISIFVHWWPLKMSLFDWQAISPIIMPNLPFCLTNKPDRRVD